MTIHFLPCFGISQKVLRVFERGQKDVIMQHFDLTDDRCTETRRVAFDQIEAYSALEVVYINKVL